MASDSPMPFENDAEYLQAEFGFLRARAARISAEKSVAVALRAEEEGEPRHHLPGRSSREAKCRAVELRQDEIRLRAEVDARLAVHRANQSGPTLGLDKLCQQHGLDERERLLLLAVAVSGIYARHADDVFGELVSAYGPVTVSEAMTILDPTAIGEWLDARRLFRADGKLRQAGLIVLDPVRGTCGPETLPSLDVRLSLAAWATLTGDPQVANELDGLAMGTAS